MKPRSIAILAAAIVLSACSKGGPSPAASPRTRDAAAATPSVTNSPVNGPLRLEGSWKVTFALKKASKGTLAKGYTMLSEMVFQPQCESDPCGGTVTVTQTKPKGPQPYTTDYSLDGDTYTWESETRPSCAIGGHIVYYRKFSKVYRVKVSGDMQGGGTSLDGAFTGKATASGSYKGQKCVSPFVAIWDLAGKPG